MPTVEQSLLQNAYDSISDAMDTVENLIDWSADEGYRAIQHKLGEALGRLDSARIAAEQYKTGELVRR